MFILSRTIGEAVLIDGRFTATVAVIGTDFVDLALRDVGGLEVKCVTLDTMRCRPIIAGARGILIKRLEEDRVRLGFELPTGVSILRCARMDVLRLQPLRMD